MMTISGASKIFLILILLGGGSFIFLRWFERSRLYYPQRELEADPSAIQLGFKDITFTAADGIRLHGWWIPAEKARGTLLFCHGNAGNISDRLESIRVLNQLGLNVFIFDYRGYGKSSGSPSEKGTYRDAAAAYDSLTAKLRIKPQALVMMGRSLGGAVAIQLAQEKKAAALICEATFTSVEELGRHFYPYLPVKLFIFDRYDSLSKVGKLSLPQLYVHSRSDDLIPFRQGKQLYEAAAEPKRFLVISGGHGQGFEDAPGEYIPVLDAFLSKAMSGEQKSEVGSQKLEIRSWKAKTNNQH